MNTTKLLMRREWGMPSLNTFYCPPIKAFVEKWLSPELVSIDPFARNSKLATHRNDLNPGTEAQYHSDARAFLHLMRVLGVVADRVILDPPYSPRQISECYKECGLPVTMQDTQNGSFLKQVRDAVIPVLKPDGIVLSFGWNSCGMGKKRGFEVLEILLVAHGAAHNDTICMAEQLLPPEPTWNQEHMNLQSC